MRIISAVAFGKIIYDARKQASLTQADLAAASGVGERFIRELEKGKPSCQLGKALLVAQMLGIKFEATLPILYGLTANSLRGGLGKISL